MKIQTTAGTIKIEKLAGIVPGSPILHVRTDVPGFREDVLAVCAEKILDGGVKLDGKVMEGGARYPIRFWADADAIAPVLADLLKSIEYESMKAAKAPAEEDVEEADEEEEEEEGAED